MGLKSIFLRHFITSIRASSLGRDLGCDWVSGSLSIILASLFPIIKVALKDAFYPLAKPSL